MTTCIEACQALSQYVAAKNQLGATNDYWKKFMHTTVATMFEQLRGL